MGNPILAQIIATIVAAIVMQSPARSTDPDTQMCDARADYYLEIEDYREAYGEVRSEFFGANPPASTLVQISNLAVPDALIEIEAVAVV